MPKYGLISETDGRTIEKTIDLICNEFTDSTINICEVGIYAGQTGSAICEYIKSKERLPYIIGIDNNKDGEELRYQYDNLIIGNSNEVYHQLEDESQHFCFIDGNHSFSAVVSDFFCYAPKVKVGSYLAFHDTGKHITPYMGYQSGALDNPDSYVAVRKALNSIGLLKLESRERFSRGFPEDMMWSKYEGWKLIFDESDETDQFGGVCVFKKIF